MTSQYTRVTRDVWVVQVYRTKLRGVRRAGWYDLHTDATSALAYATLQAYRIDWGSDYRFRIIKRRRVPKEIVHGLLH